MSGKTSWENAGYVNPYGFVSLAKEEPERKKITEWRNAQEELYTGKITYHLETISPLFIPDTSKQDTRNKEEHQEYEFFSYGDGIPVIPGSEVRGMVRSLYETLTNSCISFINENEVLSKRTPEYFKPGILRKEIRGNKIEYKLIQVYEQKDYLYRENGNKDFSVRSFESKKLPRDGSKVYFEKEIVPGRPSYAKPLAKNISLKEDKSKKVGYLLKGECGPELTKSKGSKCEECPSLTQKKCKENKETRCYLLEKHCAHIFTEEQGKNTSTNKIEKPKVIPLSKQVFEDLCKRMDIILKLYEMNADENKAVYKEYQESWKAFLSENKKTIEIPLYFSQITSSLIYVSPAKITREVYLKTIKTLLEKQAKHTCCETSSICPACVLFGTVQKELKIASRVRFSDMQVVKQETYYEPPLTLPELSSPKLSTTEFYLEKPNDGKVLNWTYDYYVYLEKNGVPKEKTYEPRLAGRKFYWHSPNTVKLLRRKIIEQNKRNKTVRPLKPKVKFSGEVYFDGITKKQLDELIAILNLSQEKKNDKPLYAAKLGAGKPVGLGSVALSVENVWIRTVDIDKNTGMISYKENSYDEMFAKDAFSYDEISLQKQFVYHEELLKFLELGALKGKIAYYPYGEGSKEDSEGFAWFAENRKAAKMDKTEKLFLNKTDAGPKSRRQTVYHRYMGSANPQLLFNQIK